MFWKWMFLQLTVGYLHGLENGEELQKTMKGLCFWAWTTSGLAKIAKSRDKLSHAVKSNHHE